MLIIWILRSKRDISSAIETFPILEDYYLINLHLIQLNTFGKTTYFVGKCSEMLDFNDTLAEVDKSCQQLFFTEVSFY